MRKTRDPASTMMRFPARSSVMAGRPSKEEIAGKTLPLILRLRGWVPYERGEDAALAVHAEDDPVTGVGNQKVAPAVEGDLPRFRERDVDRRDPVPVSTRPAVSGARHEKARLSIDAANAGGVRLGETEIAVRVRNDVCDDLEAGRFLLPCGVEAHAVGARQGDGRDDLCGARPGKEESQYERREQRGSHGPRNVSARQYFRPSGFARCPCRRCRGSRGHQARVPSATRAPPCSPGRHPRRSLHHASRLRQS